MMNVIGPKLDHACKVWEGSVKFVKQLEAARQQLENTRMLKHDEKYILRGTVPTKDKRRREKVEIAI